MDSGLALLGGCVDFRVHDVAFTKFSDAGLTVRGTGSRGVIHDGDFLSNFKCQPDPVSCLGYGVVVYGDGGAAWPDLALGTEDAVYIEDSYFHDNRHAVASNYGSRYVFRHNVVVTTARARDFGMVDAHGRGSNPPGSRSWEIYRNELRTEPADLTADGISIRGGDGVVFENMITPQIPYVAYFHDESGCSGTYPLPDQTREAYIWGNAWDGPVRIADACSAYFVEGRDYFLEPRPGYTPLEYPHPLR